MSFYNSQVDFSKLQIRTGPRGQPEGLFYRPTGESFWRNLGPRFGPNPDMVIFEMLKKGFLMEPPAKPMAHVTPDQVVPKAILEREVRKAKRKELMDEGELADHEKGKQV